MGMVVWVREVGSGVRSAAVGRLGMGIWKGTSSRSSTTPHKAYFTRGEMRPPSRRRRASTAKMSTDEVTNHCSRVFIASPPPSKWHTGRRFPPD